MAHTQGCCQPALGLCCRSRTLRRPPLGALGSMLSNPPQAASEALSQALSRVSCLQGTMHVIRLDTDNTYKPLRPPAAGACMTTFAALPSDFIA